MGKIDELINIKCPNGVPYRRIDELCNISRGIVMSKDFIKDNEGDYPVYSSQTENDGCLGCINSYNYDGEYLTWTTDGANAGTVFYRTGKFSVTNVCGLLNVTSDEILTRYLYYALGAEAPKYVSRGMGNPKLMSNVMGRIVVPVPPIEIQSKIICFLDNFLDMIHSLNEELNARKKQLAGYSMMLFDQVKSDAHMYSISDICSVGKGKTPIQKAVPGDYPMVVTTSERKTCDDYQFDANAVCVPLVSSRGHGVASLNHVYYQEGKFALGNILCAIISKDESFLFPKFLYYYFEETKDYTLVPLMKGGANVALRIDDILSVKIPVPSLEKQKKIVKNLEKFDEICNSNDTGLPAEIEARQKQYEYYRDRLLDFKKLA